MEHTNSVIYEKPVGESCFRLIEPVPEPKVFTPKLDAKPKVRDYSSPDFGAFFKDRYSLFYGGDRTTCPVCLTRTKLDSYKTRGGVRKVDHLCPNCGSAYPLIRPATIPKLRFPL